MKLFLTLLLGLLLLSPQAFAQLRVFTCEPEWKSLVEALGGDKVKAFSATTAFQDPHHIEARPSLIAKTRRADLVVCTGAELEIGWLPLLLRQSSNAKVQEGQSGYFLAATQVERIEVPTKTDRSQGDVHASGNPHVFWDPYRLLTIAKALSQRLQTIDDSNSAYYQQQLARFTSTWQSQTKQWESQAASLKGKKAIVYHKNWSYLLQWLKIETMADLEPVPGLPPTSSHLAQLLTKVRNDKPDFILIANYQDDKGAKWLSKKTGIPILRLPFTVGANKQAKDLSLLYSQVLTALLKQH